MPKDMAGRLEALADLLPERPEIAAELRELATAGRAQWSAAGKARAAVQRAANAGTQERALRLAQGVRRRAPGLSTARVAVVVKSALGPAVPEPPRLARWLLAFEAEGRLEPRRFNVASGADDAQSAEARSMIEPMELQP